MNCINSFQIENEVFYFYDLTIIFEKYPKLKNLPISFKILLEQTLRNLENEEEFESLIEIFLERKTSQEIKIYPSRIFLVDSLATSILIDFASIRDFVKYLEQDARNINPKIMFDLIVESSNEEKWKFIKWAEKSFKNLRVVPPKNQKANNFHVEYLSTIIDVKSNEDKNYLFPEIVVGTNSFGNFGYFIEGIDLETVLLGAPTNFNFPKSFGIKIIGELNSSSTSFELCSILKKQLDSYDLSGKIVEFYGEGVEFLPVEYRNEISSLILELGAFSSYYPIDDKTILYFESFKKNSDFSKLVKTYLKKQELYFDNQNLDFDESIEFDLNNIESTIKDVEDNEELQMEDNYENLFLGNEIWQSIKVDESVFYNWDKDSLEIQKREFIDNSFVEQIEIKSAGIALLLGDNISTEMISPHGQIALYSTSSKYLDSKEIKSYEYGNYEDRDGNSEIMLRGMFDSHEIKNKMILKEGGFSEDYETGEIISIFELSKRFKEKNRPLVLFAGENFGKGKQKEWAQRGLKMLGIKAIIAKSFNEKFRKALIAFGVLPLEFLEDENQENLNIEGDEIIDITFYDEIKPKTLINLTINSKRVHIKTELKIRLDSIDEVIEYKNGGTISYLLKKSFI